MRNTAWDSFEGMLSKETGITSDRLNNAFETGRLGMLLWQFSLFTYVVTLLRTQLDWTCSPVIINAEEECHIPSGAQAGIDFWQSWDKDDKGVTAVRVEQRRRADSWHTRQQTVFQVSACIHFTCTPTHAIDSWLTTTCRFNSK